MDRAGALDGLGQLFELCGQCLELGGKKAALILGDGFGGVDQSVEHHGDARQDRLLDALQTPKVSPITFGILREREATALWVSDEEAFDAVRFAWKRHQLVVEPGGAAALAALLSGKVAPLDDTVVVLSGGNIDPALHARIVGGA